MELHLSQDRSVQLERWRLGLASLSEVGRVRPAPLEGLDPAALEASAQVALQAGFVEEWDWHSGQASALFDLMNSLPRGTTKRELGRHLLQILYSCDAKSFVMLARSLASTKPKALSPPQIKARVALCLQLPYGILPEVDGLALALLSNPLLAQEWLIGPSTGGLAGRRLAARTLERAAREVWRQYQNGKTVGLRVFRSSLVSKVWKGLLSDRESLTWRHVAAARGILVDLLPQLDEEIQEALQQEENPWLWPAACTSLAASIAVRKDVALVRCKELMQGARRERNPQIVSAMLYGVVSAAAFEPEHAQALLHHAAGVADTSACEAISRLRSQRISTTFTDSSLPLAIASLKATLNSADDGESAYAGAILKELIGGEHYQSSLQEKVCRGMVSFVEMGANAVVETGNAAVLHAQQTIEALSGNREENSSERRIAFQLLRELDRGLLESSALSQLLRFHTTGDQEGASPLDPIRLQLTAWLLQREKLSRHKGQHPCWTLAKRKVMVHLVDADEAEPGKEEGLRKRREQSISQFSNHLFQSNEGISDRVMVVVLARACDGAVRESCFELSDMVLAVLPRLKGNELTVFSEAILQPEFRLLCASYAQFRLVVDNDFALLLRRSEELVDALPWAGTPRVEAFRVALVELNQALRKIETDHRENTLCFGEEASPLRKLASTSQWLAQLIVGARRRLGFADLETAPFLGHAIEELDLGISQEVPLEDTLAGALALASDELTEIFSRLVQSCLRFVTGCTPTSSEEPAAIPVKQVRSKRVSAGLPFQRSYAGFRILRPLGNGAAGSVYVACRESDCDADDPRLFALKLPVYGEHHADLLSQSEFFSLFRREAGTLLLLPAHENLAGFVSFDLGAMPTPVLVMEYIAGPHLGILIESGNLSLQSALEILDGIAAGLQTMHRFGIGHLDVKPENIVLRKQSPVLVDFGLAGPEYHPGRTTISYGAPEILIGTESGNAVQADVYSFSCLAFELLTASVLFSGESVQQIVGKHLMHDGTPPKLVALSKSDPSLLPLTRVLARGLRREPEQRSTMTTFRSDLAELAKSLAHRKWPL